MELTTTHRLPFPAARVFASIRNPDLLRRCVNGCEKIISTSENCYDAHVRIGSGFFRGLVVVKIEFTEINPKESIALRLRGNAAPGGIEATVAIRFADSEKESELQCRLQLDVKGMIALIGSRKIEAAARRLLEQFFARLDQELADSSEPTVESR